MKLCPVAGCIVAGNTLMADPLRELGAISVARRAVIALKQAGVFPVAVVSDASDDELRYRLASQGLVFLRQPDPKAQLFSSIRVGLEYLADKCERVVVAPVNSPLFAPSTVMALARSSADAAVPEYHGRRGHPVLVSCAALPEILAYDGDHGMAGALRSLGDRCATVPVEDPGILVTVHDADDLDPRLKAHNEQLVRPVVRVSLERESSFFDERTRLLLYLVDDTRSLRAACDLMALSYAKGRALVNELEDVLGEKVLERRRGGRDGGSSTLTPEARDFLERYQQLDEHATRSAQELFARLFPRLGHGA